MAQHRIAAAWAAAVVDLLEIVEVDRQHRAMRGRVALHPVDLELQPLHQAPPVGHAGQEIGGRLPGAVRG